MRQAGRMKGGFYAANNNAVTAVLKKVLQEVDERAIILDPCCGEGEAIHHIGANILDINPKQVYACELEPTRFKKAVELMPGSRVINSDWLSASCDIHSFSFVWLNPPFDDEIGGGTRMEHEFLKATTNKVVTGGIMCLVCPLHVALENYGVRTHIATYYEDTQLVKFPEEHASYGECAVFGVKRSDPTDYYDMDDARKNLFRDKGIKYSIPRGYHALHFSKSVLLESEIDEAMERSPLCKSMQSSPEVKAMSPPLSLGAGHVALLLSSGYLNGVVRPTGERPHVVRGTAKKITYVSDITEAEGKVTVTKSEKISMVVRAITADGVIKTFSDEPEDATAVEPSDD